MILTDAAILQAIADGAIVIKPFNRECLGTNSYDVHLGKHLATYRERVLDAKTHNQIERFEIPENGYVLEPAINRHSRNSRQRRCWVLQSLDPRDLGQTARAHLRWDADWSTHLLSRRRRSSDSL